MNQYKYWNNNIEKFGGFYDANPDETVSNNVLFQYLYKKLIFPFEQKVTIERLIFTDNIINAHIKDIKNKTIIDLGCGNGIYTELLKNLGCRCVYSADFSQKALELTRDRVKNISTILLDIEQEKLPIQSDVVIAMGITPYVDIHKFFDNVLPTTNTLIYQVLDNRDIFNIIRQILPFLNVRSYHFVNRKIIEACHQKHGFKSIMREKCGTSYIEVLKRI